MAKPKFKFGYTVSYRLAPAQSFAMRADFTFRVGIVNEFYADAPGNRTLVRQFNHVAQLEFVSFAETPRSAVEHYTNRYAFHPMDLPIVFNPHWQAGFDMDLVHKTEGLVFSETNAGSLAMGQLHRWYETPAVLSLVGSCIDYPDDNMSFAASKRFDEIRDVWDRLDDMARFWYCLYMRGAKLIAISPQTGAVSYVTNAGTLSPAWFFGLHRDTVQRCQALKDSVNQLVEA